MIFFTSDIHAGHANISEYTGRPFPWGPVGVPAMNEALISNWNKTVSPNDTVWILGDLAMGRLTETLPLVTRLNGKKILVPGNHDQCFVKIDPDSPKQNRKLTKALLKAADYLAVGLELRHENQDITLPSGRLVTISHFPYKTDDTDGRFKWAAPDPKDFQAKVLLCGHIHEKWQHKLFEDRLMINVGVDVHDLAPVSVDALEDLITNLGF